MRQRTMESKQRLFTSCVVLHVASHMLLAASTPGTTSASPGDAFHTTTASVENTDETYGNLDVAGLNMPPIMHLAILAQGSASMRLRSSGSDAVDEAIWVWYTYCEQYVLDASRLSGYDKSQLVHSYDWVKIDDTRLDVLFVGIYHSIGSETASPMCLDSSETRDNTSSSKDMCTRLTLGHFGEYLSSGRQAKLTVATNASIEQLPQLATHLYSTNSVNISRLSISNSFGNVTQSVSLQSRESRSSIFDRSIRLLSNCLPDEQEGPGWLLVEYYECNGEYIAEKYYQNNRRIGGRATWTANTPRGTRFLYSTSATTWTFGALLGRAVGEDLHITQTSTPPMHAMWARICQGSLRYIDVGITFSNCYSSTRTCAKREFEGNEMRRIEFVNCNNPVLGIFHMNAQRHDDAPTWTANRPEGTLHMYRLDGKFWGIGANIGLRPLVVELEDAGGTPPSNVLWRGCGGQEIVSSATSTCYVCSRKRVTLPDRNTCVCAAGQWMPTNGICTNCQTNTYREDGSPEAACLRCPSNQIDPVTTKVYTMTTASSGSPSPGLCLCPAQFYKTSDTTCRAVLCRAGQELRAGVCQNCFAGTFRDGDSPNECTSCGPGKSSSALGATAETTCQLCVPGTYTNGNSRNVCTSCAAGKSSSAVGATAETTCEWCVAGTYTGATAETTCQSCVPGTYTNGNSRNVCTSCGAGKSSSEVGATAETTCQTCVAGTYTDGILRNVCTSCAAGKASSEVGATAETTCQPCATGTYKILPGPNQCTPCPVGAYTAATGAVSIVSCISCGHGTHPRSDRGACEPCPSSYSASVLTNALSGTGPMPGCIQFVGV